MQMDNLDVVPYISHTAVAVAQSAKRHVQRNSRDCLIVSRISVLPELTKRIYLQIALGTSAIPFVYTVRSLAVACESEV